MKRDQPSGLEKDEQDLKRAQAKGLATLSDEKPPLPFWKYLGPGLITGAADDDPSGVGT